MLDVVLAALGRIARGSSGVEPGRYTYLVENSSGAGKVRGLMGAVSRSRWVSSTKQFLDKIIVVSRISRSRDGTRNEC